MTHPVLLQFKICDYIKFCHTVSRFCTYANAANPSSLLPNPRLVSTTVHSHFDVPSGGTTLMTAMFGQFLDHDLTLTPEGHIEEHGECCTPEALRGEFEAPCFPVVLPRSDTFFQDLAQTQQVGLMVTRMAN